jgi:AraC family transcriptional regulator
MSEQRHEVLPNIIRAECSAGTVEHAWLPTLDEGGYVSMSAPSGVCLTFSEHRRCLVVTGGKRSLRDVEPGCVQIAGAEPLFWHAVHGPSDVVEVTATPETRRAIATELRIPDRIDLDDLHGGTDPVIWAIAARLRTLLRARAAPECLEYEALIHELYRHVFITRFGGRAAKRGDGKLGKRRLGRVLSYVDTHLMDRGLTVAALSSVASLTPFHFLRSFRRTLNMTPHAYVRALRLERARAEIAAGAAVAHVAERYGFKHLRHFRVAYTRHHGVAPTEPAHTRDRRAVPSPLTARSAVHQ